MGHALLKSFGLLLYLGSLQAASYKKEGAQVNFKNEYDDK